MILQNLKFDEVRGFIVTLRTLFKWNAFLLEKYFVCGTAINLILKNLVKSFSGT